MTSKRNADVTVNVNLNVKNICSLVPNLTYMYSRTKATAQQNAICPTAAFKFSADLLVKTNHHVWLPIELALFCSGK